jgi:Autotransporter beta-domain
LSKRVLMLSAAAVALLTAPALAAGPTEITASTNASQKTSTTGDLTIDAGANLTFKSATVPTVTIDSSNFVLNNGTIDGSGQATQTAVLIDTTAANLGTGAAPIRFENAGAINLGGDGTGKTALHLTGAHTFFGNILFDATSVVTISGDGGTGIHSESGSILDGNISFAGSMTMASSTVNATSSTGVALMVLNGITNGDVTIASASTLSATGTGAVGVVIGGPINHCDTTNEPSCTNLGTFSNSGTIAVNGVSVRSTTKKNNASGSALVVESSIAGGIVNNGPVVPGDVGTIQVASISANGSSAPTILITPLTGAVVPIHVGIDTLDPNASTGGQQFSFINRGTITAAPEDPNDDARTIVIGGLSSSAPVNFDGGIFNSGTISAAAASGALNGTSSSSSSVNNGSAVTARALEIDNFTNIPLIRVSSQTLSSPTPGSSGGGAITATIAGPKGGEATAILISGTSTNVHEIDVDVAARIAAVATVTDPTAGGIGLTAVAIEDDSGSLSVIKNAGSIQASATTLNNGATAQATAVNVSHNTTGVSFTNTGVVVGDVFFGSGSDDYEVIGTASAPATQTGSIDFGTNISGTNDILHVGTFANVAGTITSEGDLDVTVDQHGVLTVKNLVTSATTNLQVHNFNLATGNAATAGTLNITVSQGNATNPTIQASGTVTFGAGANLNVAYGSLLTSGGGTFELIAAPDGQLNIAQSDVDRYNNQVGGVGNIPFLLKTASISVDTTHYAGLDVLVLKATPKNATDLGLKGYAKAMFALANTAVASDPDLGAALIAGVTDQKTAQKAFDAFAPDVSGGVRQVAISLTDQATGPVAGRLRDLRLFAREPGDLTLWGTEFGQYMTTHGGMIAPSALKGSLDDTGGVAGFKDHGFGFALGIDEGSPEDGWYGAAFSFYTGDVSENGDKVSKTQSLWYMLTGYSTWRGKALFVDAQANVGYGDFKGKRTLQFTIPATSTTPETSFAREADSKRAGLVASLGLTLGAMLKYGGLTTIPQISFDGMSMREEGYTERNGGTGFDLAVKPYYANSLRVFVGDEMRTSINFGDFFLQPSARLGYRYDFLNDPVRLKAQFADINTAVSGNQPGALFTLRGPDPSQGNYVAGAALNATTENWTIGLSYDFVRGSNNATEQVGTISLLGRI